MFVYLFRYFVRSLVPKFLLSLFRYVFLPFRFVVCFCSLVMYVVRSYFLYVFLSL